MIPTGDTGRKVSLTELQQAQFTVICCNCLQTYKVSEKEDKVEIFNSYPLRAVAINGKEWICPDCGNSDDVIVFSFGFITKSAFISNELIREKNEICYKRRKLMLMTLHDAAK
jgi:hypothetical protein